MSKIEELKKQLIGFPVDRYSIITEVDEAFSEAIHYNSNFIDEWYNKHLSEEERSVIRYQSVLKLKNTVDVALSTVSAEVKNRLTRLSNYVNNEFVVMIDLFKKTLEEV